MKYLIAMFFAAVSLIAAPPSSRSKAKPSVTPTAQVPPIPTPKEQVSNLRRIATQALDDIEQRLSTDDIAKLAPYREDPDTSKELLLSILQDRIATLSSVYAKDLDLIGPLGFKMKIDIKTALLNRGIRRLTNWKPDWAQEQIEKMFTDKTDTIATPDK